MAELLLRDGQTTTSDPRLDLIPRVDPRSLDNYPIAPLLTRSAPPAKRGRTWRAGPVLDQGREGACVGFALVGELAADPGPRIDNRSHELAALARRIYRRAQELDPWPETRPGGEEGTDLTSGGAAVVELGFADEYRWGDSVDDLARILARTKADAASTGAIFGPAAIAVEWRDGMYEATRRVSSDLPPVVDVTGPLVGYHAILIRGVIVSGGRYGFPKRAYRWRNSWGDSYGLHGDAVIEEDDLAAIAGARPSIMVPVTRLRGAR